jgi:two-component SAPR family response regulator
MPKRIPSGRRRTATPEPQKVSDESGLPVVELNQTAFALRHENPDEAWRLASEALRRSEAEHNEPEIARAKLTLARVQIKKGFFAEALTLLGHASQLLEAHKQNQELEVTDSSKAECYLRLGNYPAALLLYERLLERYQRENADGNVSGHLSEKQAEREASLLNNIASVYRYQGNIEKSIAYNTQSLERKRQSTNTFSLVYSLVNLGTLYQETGAYHEALRFLEEALQLMHTHHPTHPMHAATLGNYGNTLLHLGDYSKALEYNLRSLKVSESRNDKLQTANALENLGNYFMTLGDSVAALGYFKASLELAEQISTQADNTATALRGIASVYASFGNFLTAIDYEFRSLHIAKSIGHKQGEAESYLHLGMFYNELGSYADALKYLLLCRQLRQTLHDTTGEADVLKHLGVIYARLENTDAAIEHFKASLDLAERNHAPRLQAESHLALAELWLSLERHAEAETEAQKVLHIAETLQNKKRLAEAHKILSDVLFEMGKSGAAATHRRKHESLERELKNTDSVLRAKQMMAEFDLERIQKEIGVSLQEHLLKSASEKTVAQPAQKLLPRKVQMSKLKAATADASIKVIVQTFGRFSVGINGKVLEPDDWKRKKARDVFKVLLLNYGQTVPTDVLIDAVWGDVDVKNVESLVMNAISQARKALSLFAPAATFIKSNNRGYVLDFGDRAEIDFLKFKAMLAEAANMPLPRKEKTIRDAIGLYRGEFLREDLFEEWSAFERESLKDAYLNALRFLAEQCASRSRLNETIGYAKKMLEHDRLCEPAYQILFSTLQKLNRVIEAQKAFQECKAAYKKALNAAPPKRLQEFFS